MRNRREWLLMAVGVLGLLLSGCDKVPYYYLGNFPAVGPNDEYEASAVLLNRPTPFPAGTVQISGKISPAAFVAIPSTLRFFIRHTGPGGAVVHAVAVRVSIVRLDHAVEAPRQLVLVREISEHDIAVLVTGVVVAGRSILDGSEERGVRAELVRSGEAAEPVRRARADLRVLIETLAVALKVVVAPVRLHAEKGEHARADPDACIERR
jgi:hypothetical protein